MACFPLHHNSGVEHLDKDTLAYKALNIHHMALYWEKKLLNPLSSL